MSTENARADLLAQGLILNLQHLMDPPARAAVNRRIGNRLVTLTKQGFDKSQDPYGKAWAKLKTRAGKPLNLHGKLRDSFEVSGVTGSRFLLSSKNRWFGIHQRGKVIVPKKKPYLAFQALVRDGRPGVRWGWVYAKKVTIPSRAMLPDSRGVPPAWTRVIDEVVDSELRKRLGQGRGAA